MDGLAFGRPLLRRPADRPSIDIPPRKRRRVTYDEDEDDNEGFLTLKDRESLEKEDGESNEDDNRQLVLHAEFEDEDSEDDDDFAPSEDDEDEDNDDKADDEVESDVESDEDQQIEEEDDGEEHLPPSENDPEDATPPSGQSSSLSTLFHKLHSAFPESPIAVCKHVLGASHGDLSEAYDAMARGFKPSKSKTAITGAAKENLSVPKTRTKKPEIAEEELENQDDEDVELEENTDPLLDYYDQNGLPQGSISSGTALLHMAEVLKTSSGRTSGMSNGRVTSNKSVRFADEALPEMLTSTPAIDLKSQTDDSEDQSDEETSSSGSSSSSDNETGDAEVSESSSSGTDSDSVSSESSSDSSSDDDSAPEETSSKTIPPMPASVKETEKSSTQESTRNNARTKPVIPNQGKRGTKSRNIRRKTSKALARFKEKGILPDDTTSAEFQKLGIHVDTTTTKEEALVALDAVRAAPLPGMDEDFLARRQELLDSLNSGGIEVGTESLKRPSKSPPAESTKRIAIEKPEKAAPKEADVSPQAVPPTPVESGDNTTPPSRRARLDLGAGRRLLFGALGFKNPKTKTDEQKLREDLMKDVRPLFTAKPAETTSDASDEDMDQDPDAWRQSITYRAVECSKDGVELSEPPFPFVQRWDPQQQGSSQRKRKKDLRNDPQYSQPNERSGKRQKLRKTKHSYAEWQEYLDGSYEPSHQEDSTVIDYDEPSQDSRPSQLNDLTYDESAGESQGPADLAPLPEDPSTLPALEAGKATTGMTIAFKQLVMSEATKWQPQVSAYRTAIVIAAPESGELFLTLALRDRKQSEKYYDEETGDRIYGRFDMPVDEDDEVEELQDDGMLNLGFGELIEPKIVQDAPDSLIAGGTLDDASPAESSEDSATQGKDGSVQDQFSHVTETSLNSEIPETDLSAQDIDPLEQESTIVSTKNANPQDPESQRSVPLPEFEEQGASDGNAETSGTPVGDVLPTSKTAESISDEARQEISYMMKEAGFRSNVPSSVMRDIRPEGMKSPGDSAVFEKLMKDMTEIESHFPSSPKFAGFGSSSPTRRARPDEASITNISQQRSSPSVPPQSSWQTVPLDECSSPPGKTQEQEIFPEVSEEGPGDSPGEGWETLDTSTPVEKTAKRKPRKKRKLHMAQPIQRAEVLWGQLARSTAAKPIVGSTVENGKDIPGLSTHVSAVDERNGNATVQYPKLPIGSSFTSLISGHGRQPDAVFDDRTTLDGGISNAPIEESVNLQDGGNDDLDFSPSESAAHDDDMEQDHDPFSHIQQKPARNPGGKLLVARKRGQEILEQLSSSDDNLPSLEEVFSQHTPKSEKSKASFPTAVTKDGELSSEESGRSTPKPFKGYSRTPQRPASQPNPKPRNSLVRSSQPPVSQSQPKQFVAPQGSQVLDLTLSSDDEDSIVQEPVVENDPEPEPSDLALPSFRRYKMADDDDDDYRDTKGKKGGWVKKSDKTEATRALRPRSSSQASPNAKTSRRRTVTRF